MSGGETVSIKYVGKHTDGVQVPLPSGESVPVAHGETVELPAEVAASLLEQEESWEAAGPAGRAAKGSAKKQAGAADTPEKPPAEAEAPAARGG